MLARSILNSISEALKNNEVSHEHFITIINEEKKYRELNENIRRIKSQRNDTEKNNLIEKGKRIRINEAIKRNEIINNSLKP